MVTALQNILIFLLLQLKIQSGEWVWPDGRYEFRTKTEALESKEAEDVMVEMIAMVGNGQ